MKRLTVLSVFVILLTSCATHQAVVQKDRSPLWRAQMTFTGASLDYEAAMLSAQELRAAGHGKPEQWAHLDSLQTVIQSKARVVHSLLEAWAAAAQASGDAANTEPGGYQAAFNELTAGVAEAKKIIYEVK